MNLLHAPRATNLSNANHRIPSRYPDVRLSGSPANQSGTACVTPEDELPRRCTARLSLRRTISHIGNLICASRRGRADRSHHDGCRDEWCFHCLHPFGWMRLAGDDATRRESPAGPQHVGVSDLERDRVAQRGQPALGPVAVLFVDDVEQVLQLGPEE
jgi:hypothetical protein